MRRSFLPFILTGAVSFAAGGLAGLWVGSSGPDSLLVHGLRAVLEGMREPTGTEAESREAPASTDAQAGRAPADREMEPRFRKPPPENPFREADPGRLIAVLNRPHGEKDGELRHQATEALLELARREPSSLAPLLSGISRHGLMHQVCRELVLRGGDEGLDAVLGFILDRQGDTELRAEAIHTLGALPLEGRGPGIASLLELASQPLPYQLQHSVCDALGEISGNAGVQNLLGLLEAEGSRIRPDILLDTIGKFAKPGDVPRLLGLLNEGSWTREVQTDFLRAVARASRSGDLLLDLIAEGVAGAEGPSASVIAKALCDSAQWIDIAPDKLLAALRSDLPPDVRGNLSRALVRSGGDGELERLVAHAHEEGSGVDANALGAALADRGGRGLLPAMAEILADVSDPDTLHNLTRSIVESGGREGVEALLDLLGEGDLSARHLHPVCGSIAESGAPGDADRLFEALERVRDTEGALALLKAAASLSPEEGLDRCLGLLDASVEGDVRAAAADVVGRRGASEHLPLLVDVLSREEFGRAQWELTRAIAQAGDEGLTKLADLLQEDPNERRQHEVLSSLSHLEGCDATPVFSRALMENPHAGIRAHAAEVLGKQGDEAAARALAEAARRESDPWVRDRIAVALSKAIGR